MLKFREFIILEQKIQDSKNKLQKFITESVQQFRQDMKIFTQTGIKSPALVILQSVKDVQKLTKVDLKQTEQNKKAMTKFMNDFEKLNNQEQMQLVQELSKPLNGKYIENNNEVKLILIYNSDKNSPVGQEAYNAVVMNKDGMLKQAAQEKVIKGQLRADQAADYVQEMFLTLCGGGDYNAQNGGKYSLDAYDPFSGVPFNQFVKTKVIPAAFNKFQANYNTSVSNDFAVAKKGANVVSTDETINSGDSDDKDMTIGDTIRDDSQSGRDAADLTDEKMKKQLINRALTDPNIPKQFKLTDKEKEFLKLHYFKGMNKKDIARKLGYTEKAAAPAARLYLGTDKEEGKDGSVLKKLMGAVQWLQKQQQSKQEQ